MKKQQIRNYREQFINYLETEGYAVSTIERHTYYLDRIIIPTLGDIAFSALNLEIASKVKSVARKVLEGESSERRTVIALRRFLRYIQEHHFPLKMNWRDLVLPNEIKKDPESLSLDEIEFVFNHLDLGDFYDLRLRLFLEILFRGGLRPSEALMIDRHNDIDLAKEAIRVFDVKKKDYKWVMMPGIRPVLKKYLELRHDERPQLFIGGQHYLSTEPLELDGIKSQMRRFRKRLRKAGFKKRIYPYMFRKSYCTELIRSGMDLKSVQMNMRHADPTTTLRYYAAIKKEEAEHSKNKVMRKIKFPAPNLYKQCA